MNPDRDADLLEQGREPDEKRPAGGRPLSALGLAALVLIVLAAVLAQHRTTTRRPVSPSPPIPDAVPGLGPLHWGSHGPLRNDRATASEARRRWQASGNLAGPGRVLYAGSRAGTRVVLLIAPALGNGDAASVPDSYATAVVTGVPGHLRLARANDGVAVPPAPDQVSAVVGDPTSALLLVVTSPAVREVRYTLSTPARPQPVVISVRPVDSSVLVPVPGIWSVTRLEVLTAEGMTFDGLPGSPAALPAPPAPQVLVQTEDASGAVQLRRGEDALCVLSLSVQDPTVSLVSIPPECVPLTPPVGVVSRIRTAGGYAVGLASPQVTRVEVRIDGEPPPGTPGRVGRVDPATGDRGFLAGVGFQPPPELRVVFLDARGAVLDSTRLS